jgi:hypothetical protein
MAYLIHATYRLTIPRALQTHFYFLNSLPISHYNTFMFKDWKTTLIGVLMIAGTLAAYFGNQISAEECGAGLLAGIGFLLSADARHESNLPPISPNGTRPKPPVPLLVRIKSALIALFKP